MALSEECEKFGPNEEHLIRHFNFGHFIDQNIVIYRPQMYIMMIQRAFLLNEQSVESDALRRVYSEFVKLGGMSAEKWDTLAEVKHV